MRYGLCSGTGQGWEVTSATQAMFLQCKHRESHSSCSQPPKWAWEMARRTLVTTPVGVKGAGHRGSFPCKTCDLFSRVLVLGTEVPTSEKLTPFLEHRPAVGFLFASANLREGVLK